VLSSRSYSPRGISTIVEERDHGIGSRFEGALDEDAIAAAPVRTGAAADAFRIRNTRNKSLRSPQSR